MFVFLFSVVFSVYVFYRGVVFVVRGFCRLECRFEGYDFFDLIFGDRRCLSFYREVRNLDVLDFFCGYMVYFFFRILTEVVFGVLYYFFFGFLVLKRFSCIRFSCISVVDCYVFRFTEKFIMMFFFWVVSAFFFCLASSIWFVARGGGCVGGRVGGAGSRGFFGDRVLSGVGV